eukprot:4191045-Karenia_brevis.AAC.1
MVMVMVMMMWASLWQAVQRRTGTLQLVKVKSHQTEVDLQRTKAKLWEFVANELADWLAEAAAPCYQHPEHDIRE